MHHVFSTVLFIGFLFTSLPLAAQDNQSDSAEEEKPSKTLKWATASEVDNFGYDIYRGDQEDGPFARLTEEPIPGSGTTDEPSYYKFVDDTIDPRQDYYYYIESISIHGVRERFTPVQRVKAKLNPDGTPKKKEEKAKAKESEDGNS